MKPSPLVFTNILPFLTFLLFPHQHTVSLVASASDWHVEKWVRFQACAPKQGTLSHLLHLRTEMSMVVPVGRKWLRQWFETLNPSFTVYILLKLSAFANLCSSSPRAHLLFLHLPVWFWTAACAPISGVPYQNWSCASDLHTDTSRNIKWKTSGWPTYTKNRGRGNKECVQWHAPGFARPSDRLLWKNIYHM